MFSVHFCHAVVAVANVVFTTKPLPTYDDAPEECYHFPKRYLRRAQEAVGDWIVYYEPRRADSTESNRGGRQGAKGHGETTHGTAASHSGNDRVVAASSGAASRLVGDGAVIGALGSERRPTPLTITTR